ncbi:MAG: hypothetical protein CSA26_07400 [Desulfobacterales bacterium]|nr:MAG: hypothetical protein CSA26_07400 [Desulfobacterales bacterium]
MVEAVQQTEVDAAIWHAIADQSERPLSFGPNACHQNRKKRKRRLSGSRPWYPSSQLDGFPAFEIYFRKIAGNRIHVAALEKFPPSENSIDETVTAGYKSVLIIPLLITIGMHFFSEISSRILHVHGKAD